VPRPRVSGGAVGRTAGAFARIADSSVVLGLTRSRAWIGLLGTLLVGIVALNVGALSFNAAASKTAGTSDELRRENSALRAQIADGLSNERLQGVAVRLGLVMPEAASTLMLVPAEGDAAAAAERLRRGEITLGSTYAPPAPVVPPVVEPVATEAVAPAPIAPAATDPAAATTPAPTVTPAPAPVTTPPAAVAGGAVAP